MTSAPENDSGPALVLIDVQQGMDSKALGVRNNPDAELNMADLLAAWRAAALPVVHVQHNSTEAGSSLRPDTVGNALKPGFEPRNGEPLFGKTVNSAFIGTGLEAHLRSANIQDLVVVGLTTDHCVSTTVRMAANLGFHVRLVGNATATFERTGVDGRHISADEMHEVNLASLNSEFCDVVTTRDAMLSIKQD